MMLKKSAFKAAVIFYILPLFTLALLKTHAFAENPEFGKIKELEGQEKSVSPERIIRPNVEYKAEGLRDPFEEIGVQEGLSVKGAGKPEATERQLPVLTVQGLIWGGALSLAIINDKVVKVGDIIDGARITNITKEGVNVLFEGREYNLSSPAASTTKKPQGG